MTTVVRTDIGPFAIVPLWLIEDASPRALRTYALLAAKWANNETGECWPYRQTIADTLSVSLDTVDRSIAELETIGAIGVKPQYNDKGDQICNLYTVYTVPPGGRKSAVGSPQECGGVAAEERRGDRTDAAAGEPDPLNQTHRTRPSLVQPSMKADDDNPEEDDRATAGNDLPPASAAVSHPAATTRHLSVVPDEGDDAVLGDSAPEGNSTGRPGVDDEPSEDVLRLCTLLADLYHENGNTRPNPKQKAWYRDCRLLLTKDGPEGKGWTPAQVETIIRWALADPFWQNNIRSMPKLRKQFDHLRGRRNETLTKASTPANKTKYQSDMDRLNERIRQGGAQTPEGSS